MEAALTRMVQEAAATGRAGNAQVQALQAQVARLAERSGRRWGQVDRITNQMPSRLPPLPLRPA